MTASEVIDRWYLAVTCWGEARGTGSKGMLHVAWVIRHRAEDPKRRWPRSIPAVVTQHARTSKGITVYQFACWDPRDPNRSKLTDPLGQGPADRAAFLVALDVADSVLRAPPSADPIPGVYWYVDYSIAPPPWTKGLVEVTVEGLPFRFYRERSP